MSKRTYTLEVEFESQEDSERFDVFHWLEQGTPTVLLNGSDSDESDEVLIIESFSVEEIIHE